MAEATVEIQIRADAAQARRTLQGFEGDVQRTTSTLRNMGTIAGGVVAGALGISFAQSLRSASGAVLQFSSNMEQAAIAFEVMLGGKEIAASLLTEFTNFARVTPFATGQVVELGKRLLAMNVEGKDLIPTMRMLGDIASGVGTEKLPQLVLAFGQVKAAGRLTGMELRQFTEAGVGLLGPLAAAYKVTTAEMTDMISEGKIGFPAVQYVLEGLTGEGGKFNDMMERQSQTFGGAMANIKDSALLAAKEGLAPLYQRIRDGTVDIANQTDAWKDWAREMAHSLEKGLTAYDKFDSWIGPKIDWLETKLRGVFGLEGPLSPMTLARKGIGSNADEDTQYDFPVQSGRLGYPWQAYAGGVVPTPPGERTLPPTLPGDEKEKKGKSQEQLDREMEAAARKLEAEMERIARATLDLGEVMASAFPKEGFAGWKERMLSGIEFLSPGVEELFNDWERQVGEFARDSKVLLREVDRLGTVGSPEAVAGLNAIIKAMEALPEGLQDGLPELKDALAKYREEFQLTADGMVDMSKRNKIAIDAILEEGFETQRTIWQDISATFIANLHKIADAAFGIPSQEAMNAADPTRAGKLARFGLIGLTDKVNEQLQMEADARREHILNLKQIMERERAQKREELFKARHGGFNERGYRNAVNREFRRLSGGRMLSDGESELLSEQAQANVRGGTPGRQPGEVITILQQILTALLLGKNLNIDSQQVGRAMIRNGTLLGRLGG